MRSMILILVFTVFSFGSNLILQKGEIIAHTRIFGDSKIDPKTKNISSSLIISKNVESIKGNITITSISLKSDNLDRDEHMYKVLNILKYPKINFQIKSIKKIDENYQINGILTLNGQEKEVLSIATISEHKDEVSILGYFSINLTQFNIEPPSLLFLTVRDKIEIKYDLLYKNSLIKSF
ncbi:YceI family protein [Poseidonibacter antarcticus]|uniref:YceI family protein n=1 Tax=Poseidonibacter antarcticus TaxID=2478538 RepID=UPI0013CE7019|nr:YceI family protein [Poseidonibacter antarcticus]